MIPDREGTCLTIVSGLPRSGTSMMMQMLAAGGLPPLTDHQRAADEDNPSGYWEHEGVKTLDRDSSFLAGARGKAVKVVSEHLLSLPAEFDYRIVFMLRKLDELLASQARMLARRGAADPAGPSDGKMEGIFLRHLDKVLAAVAERPNMALLAVSYNQVFVKAREHAERVNEFLGGGLDVEAMVEAVDPSLYRNRSN